ncbi:hypothetical protein PSEUDO9AZ_30168 [Pseudomonas sp. 9AZ]|nr:hypothetical protein PSEUDO9AZ_30168 [Pseudomonas sp. 9AZ]
MVDQPFWVQAFAILLLLVAVVRQYGSGERDGDGECDQGLHNSSPQAAGLFGWSVIRLLALKFCALSSPMK